MTKLNQMIAVSNGIKSRAESAKTAVYHKVQKQELFSGISRQYRPRDEEGETLPPESKKVQYRATDALRDYRAAMSDVFDAVATIDFANTEAKGDVVVDGQTIVSNVPVTHLLFLEKQLVDIAAFVGKIPTLDPADTWKFSDEANAWAAGPTETTRTKKVPRNHVLYEATKEHPAQVQVFTEDVIVGTWSTMKFSGLLPETTKQAILERIQKLQDAVKKARELANMMEVEDVSTGEPVFAYLLKGTV